MYCLLILSGSLLLIAFFVPSFFLPSFVLFYGIDAELAFYLVAIFNGTSVFGRIIPGLLADSLGRFNVYLAAAASTTVLGFAWQAMTSKVATIAFTPLYGFTSGAIVSMFSTTLSITAPHPSYIGTYVGMGMGVASVAVLISPPLTGVILTREYGAVADFNGTAAALGTLFVFMAKTASGRGILSRY